MRIATVLVTAFLAAAGSAAAQDLNAETMTKMQGFTQALGVRCEFCHSAPRGSGEREPKRDVARAMIAMTIDLNQKVQAATGKAPNEATRIECITCHRGVSIPKRLSDIMLQTSMDKGPEAAIEQYRDLHSRYYGSASYDFSENTLISVGNTLAARMPEAAIALLKLNAEYYPKSTQTYMALAYAYTRKLDDASAIAALEKAHEIDPDNGQVNGRLEQLKSYHRRPAAQSSN